MKRHMTGLLLLACMHAAAGEPDSTHSDGHSDRVDELERLVTQLQRDLATLTNANSPDHSYETWSDGVLPQDAPTVIGCRPSGTHRCVYDQGWTLRPNDRDRIPFERLSNFRWLLKSDESSYMFN